MGVKLGGLESGVTMDKGSKSKKSDKKEQKTQQKDDNIYYSTILLLSWKQ